MKHSSTPTEKVRSAHGTSLLDRIRAIHESVGDDLNDNELTRLLWEERLPVEEGFGFLNFCDGVVTLSVPPQDLTKWYPEKGWIVADKERVAQAIAEKYELTLSEPPDRTGCGVLRPDAPASHHHLELGNGVETVVIAHPHYLKVRLFGATPGARYLPHGQYALPLGPEFLHDLSALYQP